MKKHLRSRGESQFETLYIGDGLETPPLTRRKHINKTTCKRCIRNTSAHAEKASVRRRQMSSWQKHLRSRGESPLILPCLRVTPETPPLTRRKPKGPKDVVNEFGNTSAHAEKAVQRPRFSRLFKKHLRSRGESGVLESDLQEDLETPPLTRRKPPYRVGLPLLLRNTSAHAEKARSRP